MTSNEDGIGSWDTLAAYRTEISHVDVNSWGTKATGILLNDGFTLRTNLKGLDL
jgi:hypothetical protein